MEADNLILTDEETEVRRDFSLLVILVSQYGAEGKVGLKEDAMKFKFHLVFI